MNVFKHIRAFEWDNGNSEKSLKKHGVSDQEAEIPFFDVHKRVVKDLAHSSREERYFLLGKGKRGRILTIVFTIRSDLIRIISARPASRKERVLYEKTS